MSVTNECDLVTSLPTNTVSTLVAPAGTAKARYQIVLKQSAWTGGGALFADDMVLDQISGPTAPVIGNLLPGALLLANPANGITFTASSSSGTTINAPDIHMTVNGADVSASLIISGSSSSKSVAYQGLTTNTEYNVSIQVTDVLGLSTSSAFSFDTWVPYMVWEGEDYDFGSGQFINSPVLSSAAQASSYFGQTGSQDVDFNESNGDGDHLYRSFDRIATTVAGDVMRKNFLDAQAGDPLIKDYKVGWFNGGEWVNYTRNFPAGTYNIYARLAGGQGAATVNLSKVTGGAGTASQTLSALGKFSFTGTSWSVYQYVPLRDAYGNLAQVALSGTNTLRFTTGGGADVNFLMLVAPDTSHPVISAVYPDGSTLLQGTNVFSFNVASAAAPINDGSIGVQVNGVDVSSKLTITGSGNNKSVSYAGLMLNSPTYSVSFGATNALGQSAGNTVNFDTFSPNEYTWEGEDYDFNSGQFIDNPQTNAYFALIGTLGTDYEEHFDLTAAKWIYRNNDPMGTDVTGDTTRTRTIGTNDYNLGWFTAGEWVNYTRHYPAGSYNVYARLARGTGTNAQPILSKVTSGVGTPSQTTVPLGTFSINSRGWGSFQYVLLRDGSGSPVVFSPDGSAITLRLTSSGPETNTEANANFLMLVPPAVPEELSASIADGHLVLSFPTATGSSYRVQYKDNLTDTGWSDLANTVVGNGAIQSVADALSNGKRFYRLHIQ
jgi:hypothetical protein